MLKIIQAFDAYSAMSTIQRFMRTENNLLRSHFSKNILRDGGKEKIKSGRIFSKTPWSASMRIMSLGNIHTREIRIRSRNEGRNTAVDYGCTHLWLFKRARRQAWIWDYMQWIKQVLFTTDRILLGSIGAESASPGLAQQEQHPYVCTFIPFNQRLYKHSVFIYISIFHIPFEYYWIFQKLPLARSTCFHCGW